jgi:hypothetical protein
MDTPFARQSVTAWDIAFSTLRAKAGLSSESAAVKTADTTRFSITLMSG